jgi:hypothetical protein
VAEQIVTDLVSKEAFDRLRTTIFSAQAQIRASLSAYSQVI